MNTTQQPEEGIFQDYVRVKNHQGLIVEYRKFHLAAYREFNELRSVASFNPQAGTVTLLTPDAYGTVTYGESESVEATLDDLRAAIWNSDLTPRPRVKRAKK